MAIIYTVAQQKGGAGKTMLAANLACWFAADRRVALLDIDPQRTLARWFGLRARRVPAAAGITFSDVSGWRLAGELDRLRRDHDVVLIDTPPHVQSDARIAIRAANLVVVPVQPSAPDIWAAEATLALAAGEKRPVRVVLNRAPATSRQRHQIEQECARRQWVLVRAALGNRIAFAAAFAVGLGVSEQAPRSVAARELQALAEELAAAAI